MLSHLLPDNFLFARHVAEWVEPQYYEDKGKRKTNVGHSRHGNESLYDEFKGDLHYLERRLLIVIVVFINLISD